ncbi:MAG: hypothetical protein QME90_05620, partial [Thermodesulfobacteriota bacterium]|nr:hypothetical protein [Thermodesulfobacteriota bacterium]
SKLISVFFDLDMIQEKHQFLLFDIDSSHNRTATARSFFAFFFMSTSLRYDAHDNACCGYSIVKERFSTMS